MWVDNIKMNLAEIGGCGVDWIYLALDRNRFKVLAKRKINLPC
jgi:hypothetical protein